VGDWQLVAFATCTEPCGGGTIKEEFVISQEAENGGNSCPNSQGDRRETKECNTQPCPVASVDCVGAWEEVAGATCSEPCDGGTIEEEYKISTQAQNGGQICQNNQGDTREVACNTQPCVPVFYKITMEGISPITQTSGTENYVASMYVPAHPDGDPNQQDCSMTADWHQGDKFCWGYQVPRDMQDILDGETAETATGSREFGYIFGTENQLINAKTNPAYVYPQRQRYTDHYTREELANEIYFPNARWSGIATSMKNPRTGEEFTDRLIKELWDNNVDIGGDMEDVLLSNYKWDPEQQSVVYAKRIRYNFSSSSGHYNVGDKVRLNHPTPNQIKQNTYTFDYRYNTGLMMFMMLAVMRRDGVLKPAGVEIEYKVGLGGGYSKWPRSS